MSVLLHHQLIPRDRLVPSPTNPRKNFDPVKLKELAGSITQQGLLNALLVRKMPVQAMEAPRFEIVCGERRWRASELAGLTELPCSVRELTDAQVIEVQYVENLQRDDLSPIEEAEGFAKLIKDGSYTAESLAEKLGKSRSHIFARLNLLKLDGAVRKAVSEGRLSPHIAPDIAKLPHAKREEAMLGVEGLSVRAAREFVEKLATTTTSGNHRWEAFPDAPPKAVPLPQKASVSAPAAKTSRVRVTQTVSMPAAVEGVKIGHRARPADGPTTAHQAQTIKKAQAMVREIENMITLLDQLIASAAPAERASAGVIEDPPSEKPKPTKKKSAVNNSVKRPAEMSAAQREELAAAARKRWRDARAQQNGREFAGIRGTFSTAGM